MAKDKKAKNKDFVLMFRATLKSKAWKELTSAEKIVYIHLKSGFTGDNNGKIHLTAKEMEGIVSKPTLYRALDGLEKKRWILCVHQGGLYQQASLYKISFIHDRMLKKR